MQYLADVFDEKNEIMVLIFTWPKFLSPPELEKGKRKEE